MADPVPRLSLTALAPQAPQTGRPEGQKSVFSVLEAGRPLGHQVSHFSGCSCEVLFGRTESVDSSRAEHPPPHAVGLARSGEGQPPEQSGRQGLSCRSASAPTSVDRRAWIAEPGRRAARPVSGHTSRRVCISGPGRLLTFPRVSVVSLLSMAPRGPSGVEGPQPSRAPVALDRGRCGTRGSGCLHPAKAPGRVCPTPNDIAQTRTPPWARRWDLHPLKANPGEGPILAAGGGRTRRQETDGRQ